MFLPSPFAESLQQLASRHRSWRTGTALVCAIILGATLAPIAESPEPARIEGRVTGSHRAPLAGAAVRLVPVDTREPLTETTDASGAFRFMQVRPGRYTIDVSHNQRHASSDVPVRFEAGETYTLDLPMVPPDDEE